MLVIQNYFFPTDFHTKFLSYLSFPSSQVLVPLAPHPILIIQVIDQVERLQMAKLFSLRPDILLINLFQITAICAKTYT